MTPPIDLTRRFRPHAKASAICWAMVCAPSRGEYRLPKIEPHSTTEHRAVILTKYFLRRVGRILGRGTVVGCEYGNAGEYREAFLKGVWKQ